MSFINENSSNTTYCDFEKFFSSWDTSQVIVYVYIHIYVLTISIIFTICNHLQFEASLDYIFHLFHFYSFLFLSISVSWHPGKQKNHSLWKCCILDRQLQWYSTKRLSCVQNFKHCSNCALFMSWENMFYDDKKNILVDIITYVVVS